MKLLEYQAKQQFATAGIAIPQGRLARTPEEAVAAARELGGIAVKAQVPIGGRGKAGGIAVVGTPEEALTEATRILALSIKGYPVTSVWCEKALDIGQELYLGITLDRERRRLAIIFSAAGGIDIETVAEENPERIATIWPDPFAGPRDFEIRQLAFSALRTAPELRPQASKIASGLVPVAKALYGLASRLDALTCEINPLVMLADGSLIAADGKLEIDDNAAYRHTDIAAEIAADSAAAVAAGHGEAGGEDPFEAEAVKRGLTYVHLDGYVGCIGNGAGLVMNTLDLVKAHGGEPANFLDVGGGASAEKVRNALDMVLLDPNVRGIFINIFGGITRCDEVARGIIAARDQLKITKPMVVRMTGTSEAEGRRLLQEAGITPGVSAPEAAAAIVKLTAEGA